MTSRALASLLSVFACVLACVWSGQALAQVSVELEVSVREVTVGESFSVQLEAMSSDGEAPASPELVVPPSFELRGPSVGTRQQVSISNFNMVTQTGISATWALTPSRPGLYSIGPGSVQAGGRRHEAQAVQIRVLPEGQRPRRPSRRSPFDLFNRPDPFGGPSFDDLFEQLRRGGSRFDRLPAAPPDVVPERAPNRLAFLTARVEPARAVIGQQVTLTIYAHGSQGMFQEAAGGREPSHPDFLAQRLVEDSSRQPRYQYELDGQTWIAVKVRESALFPLRAGRLEIGPLELGFLGGRYGARSGRGLRRTSPRLFVSVAEPPLAGRPPGFAGEVGSFELSAVVEPRRVTAGGAIAVTARVQGSGRLPSALLLPEQAGVEWLEPTLRDEVTSARSTLGGSRTFSYVVRLREPGEIDLGTLTLPHYDPEQRAYRVASRALGRVQVDADPNAMAAPSGGVEPKASGGPRLSELVRFRAELGPRPQPQFWADSALYWWLLGFAPTFVAASAGGIALVLRLRRWRAARADSRATHAAQALAAARRALPSGDLGAVASASERALYNAIEWATGLKARAVVRSELAATLERAGLSPELGTRAGELLERCAELRAGVADQARAEGLVNDLERLVRKLVQKPVSPRAAGAALALLLLGVALPVRAEAPSGQGATGIGAPAPERLAALGAALDRGSFTEVIDQLELWSDQGIVHPDLSFDRGVAYLARAESTAARRTDWGQAAAAFEESLHQGGGGDEAELALERIRERIATERAKANAGVVARPRLLRAFVGLFPENFWAALGALGSLACTLALALRWSFRSHRVKLGTAIAGAAGAGVLALGAGMAYGSRHLRTQFTPAVVIVEEARLLDASGRPRSVEQGPSARENAAERVPEGSLVHVAEARGALSRVEWGDIEAWVQTRELRRLASARPRE